MVLAPCRAHILAPNFELIGYPNTIMNALPASFPSAIRTVVLGSDPPGCQHHGRHPVSDLRRGLVREEKQQDRLNLTDQLWEATYQSCRPDRSDPFDASSKGDSVPFAVKSHVVPISASL